MTEEARSDLRKPVSSLGYRTANPSDLAQTIFADAILAILKAPPALVNGQLVLDEDFLRDHCGVADFSKYSLVEGATPRRIMPAEFPVLEVAEQDDEGQRMDSSKLRKSRL